MENNFLNLTENQKDEPIYRVVSIKRLFQLFDDKQNVLVKPKLWDDPFENFIMNSYGELEDGRMFSIGFREHFYGQCWTRTRESDAIWRIYSPNKNGARITTTPRKLLKELYDSSGKFKDLNCFIGKVNYYTTPKLKELLKNKASQWIIDQSGGGQAQTLLFKRTPFKHENEIRLIYNSQGKSQSDLHGYPINPIELIDDIVFDPRMKYSEFQEQKQKLRKIGYNKRIVKSNLYKAPQLSFRFNI